MGPSRCQPWISVPPGPSPRAPRELRRQAAVWRAFEGRVNVRVESSRHALRDPGDRRADRLLAPLLVEELVPESLVDHELLLRPGDGVVEGALRSYVGDGIRTSGEEEERRPELRRSAKRLALRPHRLFEPARRRLPSIERIAIGPALQLRVARE